MRVVDGHGINDMIVVEISSECFSHTTVFAARYTRLHSHRQYGTTRSHTRPASHASKIVLVASTSPGLTVHDAKPPERPPYQQ